jgi:hypothetical protein
MRATGGIVGATTTAFPTRRRGRWAAQIPIATTTGDRNVEAGPARCRDA